MPTGYTAGIIDGEITTFQEFVKKCMRAFGATIHMRDESLDKEYVPRKVDGYYKETLNSWKKTLAEVNFMSDEEIVSRREKQLQENIDYHKKRIEAVERNRVVLSKLIKEVTEWTPPTEEHINFKNFMLDQLAQTIKHDGDDSYNRESLNKAYNEMFSIDAKKIREEFIKDAKHNIKYSKENLEKEINRVEESNKWVEKLLNSL